MQSNPMPDVRPVSDLRAHMAEIMETIDTEKKPVILTKHGHGRYVLLGIAEYNEMARINQIRDAVEAGLQDMREGRHREFGTFAKELFEDMRDGKI